MKTDYSKFLSNTAKGMQTSAIREILKAANDSKLISLAGGLPASESFPTEEIKKIIQEVIESEGPVIFQYGITEGRKDLRKTLSEYLAGRGIKVTDEDINISTGAQGAIDAAAKVLIDQGDYIGVESPTFLASIKNFKSYSPRFVELHTDNEGVVPKELEKILNKKKLKFIYVIPNFQNPTGVTLSLKRRKELAVLAKKYDFIIVEDDPYYELRYKGNSLPTIYSFAPENTVYIGTFSKILSPGMRVGYYIAPTAIREAMTSARQAVDVHTNTLAQAVANKYVSEGYLKKHLPKIISIYTPRMEAMLKLLHEYLPKGFKATNPDGGMYVWLEGPEDFDAKDLYKMALKKGIAFVPGEFFFVNPKGHANTMRLNFTNVSEENIKKAVMILGEITKNVK